MTRVTTKEVWELALGDKEFLKELVTSVEVALNKKELSLSGNESKFVAAMEKPFQLSGAQLFVVIMRCLEDYADRIAAPKPPPPPPFWEVMEIVENVLEGRE
jgi:hypothetical protein